MFPTNNNNIASLIDDSQVSVEDDTISLFGNTKVNLKNELAHSNHNTLPLSTFDSCKNSVRFNHRFHIPNTIKFCLILYDTSRF